MKIGNRLRSALAQRCMPGDDRTWLDVVREACVREGSALQTVLSGSRSLASTRARHAAWVVLREAGYSYPEIAREFGCDHTTVLAGVKVRLARASVKAEERRSA